MIVIAAILACVVIELAVPKPFQVSALLVCLIIISFIYEVWGDWKIRQMRAEREQQDSV